MKRILTILAAIAFTFQLCGQDMSYSPLRLYMFDLKQLSPAFTGLEDEQVFAANYQVNHSKIAGAPSTFFIGYENHIKEINSGLGIVFRNEKIGVRMDNHMSLLYNYRLGIDDSKSISIGTSIKRRKHIVDFSQLQVGGDADPVTTIRVVKLYDFEIGVNYQTEHIGLGLNVDNVLQSSDTYRLGAEDVTIKNARMVKSYIFKETQIADWMRLNSSVVFQSDFNAWILDLNNTFRFRKLLLGFNIRGMDNNLQYLVNAGLNIDDLMQLVVVFHSDEYETFSDEGGITGEAMLRIRIKNE